MHPRGLQAVRELGKRFFAVQDRQELFLVQPAAEDEGVADGGVGEAARLYALVKSEVLSFGRDSQAERLGQFDCPAVFIERDHDAAIAAPDHFLDPPQFRVKQTEFEFLKIVVRRPHAGGSVAPRVDKRRSLALVVAIDFQARNEDFFVVHRGEVGLFLFSHFGE